jgi:pteridine reductase
VPALNSPLPEYPVGHPLGRPAALVTGGAVRLGRAIAIGLARAGYDIALHYNRSEPEARAVAAEIRDLGARCALFPCDLAETERLPGLIARVTDEFENLTVLVNSASTYESGPIAETTEARFDRAWTVNLKAPFFLIQEFARQTGARPAASHPAASPQVSAPMVRERSIVNVIDNKIAFNQYHYAAYLLAKKSLAELTKMAALEFAPEIRVNGVAPGVILPAAVRSEEYLRWRRQAIPVADPGHPDHIIAAINYLLANRFVTGQILFVDGGESIDMAGRNATTFPPAKNS